MTGSRSSISLLPKKGPNLPGKELSSIDSRAPAISGGYVCAPTHDSITAHVCSILSWCSLQHCMSFPVHLLRDLGHHRGGSCDRGAFACPRERSLPHRDSQPKSSIFSPAMRDSGLNQRGSCRNRQSEERILAAGTYCRNVLAVCEPGFLLHRRAVL